MKTTVSTKGQLILPAEIRRQDDIEPGQEFEVERIDRGEYRLVRQAPRPNEGLVAWLTNAPGVEWLQRNECEMAVDPIVLGEIRFGIHLLPAGKRRRRLEIWFQQGVGRDAPPPVVQRRPLPLRQDVGFERAHVGIGGGELGTVNSQARRSEPGRSAS